MSTSSNSDVEKGVGYVETIPAPAPVETSPYGDNDGLKKALKPRHLTFISIGAAIGTGIFLGIGSSLVKGGPVGTWLAFSVMCSVVICVMIMVGEMVTFLPVTGGHIRLAGRFVDPAMSIAMGLNYYICWVLILAAEISAAAILVSYWTDLNAGIWMAIGLLITLCLNAFGAQYYGEAEVIFASIKVITMVGLIILGIVIDAGGGPNHKPIGFQYWRNPGPFVQYLEIPGTTGRFLGFFACLAQAAFSTIGTEMLALAAAETQRPRKVLPIALRTVWIRIVGIYFLGSLVVGMICPSNEPQLGASSTAASSPFVIAIENAGIRVLPHIINACIITSALSAASSDLYTTSRSLHTLAIQGVVPKWFKATTKNGVPWLAVLFSWLFGFLAFLGLDSSAETVFTFLVNLTGLSGILTWLAISITYVRFRRGMKHQGIPRSTLPWLAPFGLGYPAAIWTMFIISIVTVFSGWPVFRKGSWVTADFFSNYLPIGWFMIFYIGYKIWFKTSIVTLDKMDFVSDIAQIEAEDAAWAKIEEEKHMYRDDRRKPWYRKVMESI